MLHTQWVCATSLRLGSFAQSYKELFQQTFPTFDLLGDIIFIILDKKQICPLFQRVVVYLQGCSYTKSLEKIIQEKHTHTHTHTTSVLATASTEMQTTCDALSTKMLTFSLSLCIFMRCREAPTLHLKTSFYFLKTVLYVLFKNLYKHVYTVS